MTTRPRQRLSPLSLAIQYPGGTALAPSRPQVRRWVRAACARPAVVTVRFVDADEGSALNSDYRGKPHATNVLSFCYSGEDATDTVEGDLAVCIPVVTSEAEQQKKPLEAHYAHLIVHGMLHLQGFDHETSQADAAHMEQRERDILGSLGYPDPYR